MGTVSRSCQGETGRREEQGGTGFLGQRNHRVGCCRADPIRVTTRLSKPRECATVRVNPGANYRLGLMIMYRYRLISGRLGGSVGEASDFVSGQDPGGLESHCVSGSASSQDCCSLCPSPFCVRAHVCVCVCVLCL